MHKKRKVELIQFHIEETHRLIQELNEENSTNLHLCMSESCLSYCSNCYKSFDGLLKSIHQRYAELPEYQGGRGD